MEEKEELNKKMEDAIFDFVEALKDLPIEALDEIEKVIDNAGLDKDDKK